MRQAPSPDHQPGHTGSARKIFGIFLRLGLTSFGGPLAHLVYFRREFVQRRRWLSEHDYAQLVGLCQFLPGPASSQVGFGLGLLHGGWPGAVAAFLAFTLPSALLMVGFAMLLPGLSGPLGSAGIQGLKLVALAVVAHGLLGMSRQLCPDLSRRLIATGAAAVILLSGQPWVQILVIALGALAGLGFCRGVQATDAGRLMPPFGPRTGARLFAAFALLLLGLPLAAEMSGGLVAVFEGFYRAGALVFGGGHVVLPLLEQTVVAPGWVDADDFLSGYGAAQAVPGPMFTLAAYLGARIPGADGGVTGAAVALGGIFLPGFLLVAGALPLWRSVVAQPLATRAVAGVNAAVVGLLAAALYDPVWVSAVRGPVDLAIGVIGFLLLARWAVPALIVVAWCVGASLLSGILS